MPLPKLAHFIFVALLVAGVRTIAGAAEKFGPLAIKAGVAQLFVDDDLIEAQTGLKRTLHQPKKDDGGNVPVLELGDEFGGHPAMLHGNGTIIFDPRLKKYVMFARASAHSLPAPESEQRRIYRFTSPDGLQWTKGDDGTAQRIAIDLSDPDAHFTGIDLFSCCYDAANAEYPYQGWLYLHAVHHGPTGGVYYLRSRDGRQWERGVQVTFGGKIEQDGRSFHGPEDVTLFSFDPAEHRWLGNFKFMADRLPGSTNGFRSRGYAWLDALNAPFDLKRIPRVDLVPAGRAENGDQPSDEYYASSAWRYESLWLGGLKIWHREGNYPYSPAGSAFLKLVVSRDALHWKKVPFANDSGVPEVFIPNGPEGGNGGRNDGGYLCEFSQGPLRLGDELIYYYGCSSTGKNHPPAERLIGGGIFRARLRPDGFVSVDAGELTTKPLRFEGKELFVNGIGPITVTALAPGDDPIGAATLSGDSLRHAIKFDGQSLRDCTRSGVARLKFSVGDTGRLYSFTIR